MKSHEENEKKHLKKKKNRGNKNLKVRLEDGIEMKGITK